MRIISDLPRPRRFQSEAERSGREFVRRHGAFLLERKSLVLIEQSLALVAQALVLITVLHGGEVLLRSEDETAGENKATEQQQTEAREGGDVSRAANLCVELMLRKSFHKTYPQISQITQSKTTSV